MLNVFATGQGSLSAGRLRLVDQVKTLVSGATTLEDVFLREVQTAGGGMQ